MMKRRDFLTAAAIAASGRVALADGFTFRSLSKPKPVAVEQAEAPVVVAKTERPTGQIAVVLPDDTDFDQLIAMYETEIEVGPEETAPVFLISHTAATNRWSKEVTDLLTRKGASFPGWMMVCNAGKTPLRIWKDETHMLSFLTPGFKTTAQLIQWYEDRLDVTAIVDEKGREIVSSCLTQGVKAAQAKTFQTTSQTKGKQLGVQRWRQRSKPAKSHKKCPPGKG